MSERGKILEWDYWAPRARQARKDEQTALEQAAEENARIKRVAEGADKPCDVEE